MFLITLKINMKYSFRNDYSVVAHPLVLKKLLECSSEQNVGYGEDVHTLSATKMIREKIGCDDASVHFIVGGTITNLTMISHILKPYQAVISCETGHINVHETGAVEGTGHKVLTAKGKDGKLLPSEIETIVELHTDMHMVEPKLVYISNTTETGSVYTRSEIIELYKVCKKHNLYFFLDGARLASALAASDLTYKDLAEYFDAFYIGGTKNGAYFGEALVIINENLKSGIKYHIKNKGALLAKGFVCSMAFEVLMAGDLYLEIGKHSNDVALYLASKLEDLGFEFDSYPKSNQLFLKINKKLAESLMPEFPFEITSKVDEENLIIRLVTAFDTKKEHCDMLINELKCKMF